MRNASNASALLMLGEVIAVEKKTWKCMFLPTARKEGEIILQTFFLADATLKHLSRVLRQQQPPADKQKTIILGALLRNLDRGQI